MEMDFPNISKAEWLAKIQKDLKLENLDGLRFSVSDDLTISPFAHSQDLEHFQQETSRIRSDKRLQVAERFVVNDELKSEHIMFALQGGVSALFLELSSDVSKARLESIFSEVNPEFIQIHLNGETDSVHTFLDYLIDRDVNLSKIVGSMPASIGQKYFETFPSLSLLFKGNESSTPEANIASILTEIHDFFQNDPLEGHADIFQRVTASLRLSDNYFTNIGAIKAMGLLWHLYMRGYGEEDGRLNIIAEYSRERSFENIEEAYIMNSVHLLSGIIGTADVVLLDPVKGAKRDAEFTNRINRNLYHLAEQESKLNEVYDPLAGSYFIEVLTNNIAQSAWNIFTKTNNL